MALQSDQEFAPTQIARAVFPTAFRGYDQDAVRRYLSRLASALEQHQEYPDVERLEARTPAHERVDELEDEITRLRRRNEQLEDDLARVLDEAENGADPVDGAGRSAASAQAEPVVEEVFDETKAIELLGKETARVLESARSAAADITKRAETSAETMVSEAERELADARRDANALVADRQAEAEALVAKVAGEAEDRAARIKADAEHHRAMVVDESSKILADAETEAAAEQRRAEERARQVVADAETLRQQVISELVSDRRQAQTELDRIKASRDRLAMSLAVARAELDEVAEALEAATSPMTPADQEPSESDSAADAVAVDRLIADLDASAAASAPPDSPPEEQPAVEQSAVENAGGEQASGPAGGQNGTAKRGPGGQNRKGQRRKGQGRRAKGAGAGPADGGSNGASSPSPAAQASQDKSSPAKPADAPASGSPASDATAEAIPADGAFTVREGAGADQATGEQQTDGAPGSAGDGNAASKRSGRDRTAAKKAGAATSDGANGSPGSSGTNGSAGTNASGAQTKAGAKGKRRSKADRRAATGNKPIQIEDAETAPVFQDVAGRFESLKGEQAAQGDETAAAPAVDTPAATDAVKAETSEGASGAAADDGVEPEVIDLTDGSGEGSGTPGGPGGGGKARRSDGRKRGAPSSDGTDGGLVTVVAVEADTATEMATGAEAGTDPAVAERPAIAVDAAKADVSIRERSLVDGFTTIDVADTETETETDANTNTAGTKAARTQTKAEAELKTAASGRRKAALDEETDLGIDPLADDDRDAEAAGEYAKAARSIGVSGPTSPEQVITTVASRTAASQPDRTRGDLLMDTPFAGRLPKEFAARDLALTRSGPNFRRQLRRALNDDQSDVLDRIRAGRGQIKVEELPGFGDQIDRYLAPLRRGLAEVAQSGAKAGGGSDLSHSALDNLVRQLARFVVDKVRVPTIQVIEQSADHDREKILEPIRALYREFRNVGLVDLADDALYEAFAIGLYDAIEPSAPVMWMVDPRCDPDPVCEINRDRIDVAKGDIFPSGHVRPLSLPGCRCLVAIAEY